MPVLVIAPGGRLKGWGELDGAGEVNGVGVSFTAHARKPGEFVAVPSELDLIERGGPTATKPPGETLSAAIERAGRLYPAAAVVDDFRRMAPSMQVICRDRRYVKLPRPLWDRVFAKSCISKEFYRPEVFDCDDFARGFCSECSRRFAVNGVGDVSSLSSRHAFNAVLLATADGAPPGIAFIEP